LKKKFFHPGHENDEESWRGQGSEANYPIAKADDYYKVETNIAQGFYLLKSEPAKNLEQL